MALLIPVLAYFGFSGFWSHETAQIIGLSYLAILIIVVYLLD